MNNLEKVWDDFKNGQLDAAVQGSIKLINEKSASKEETPLLNILMIKSMSELCNGNSAVSFEVLYEILELYPECELAKSHFLSLLSADHSPFSSVKNTWVKDQHKGRLIFGLGTGRSGSSTLTKIFMSQPGTYASHEHRPVLRWENGEDMVDWHVSRMSALLKKYDQVVDVSHWWLPYVEYIVKKNPDARFVIIKRDRMETVNSFLKVKGGGGKGSINHWVIHDGSYFKKNIWDDCYPKLEANDLEESITSYYDYYYERSETLEIKYPQNVKIINLDQLNSKKGIKKMLVFCGQVKAAAKETFRENVGGVQDGMVLKMNPFR